MDDGNDDEVLGGGDDGFEFTCLGVINVDDESCDEGRCFS